MTGGSALTHVPETYGDRRRESSRNCRAVHQ
jgi:hypothetical protein